MVKPLDVRAVAALAVCGAVDPPSEVLPSKVTVWLGAALIAKVALMVWLAVIAENW